MMLNLHDVNKLLEFTFAEYSIIRREYWANVFDAVGNFLDGKRNIQGFFNDFRLAISESYYATANLAWEDGGSQLPLDEAAKLFLDQTIQQEYLYVDQLAERYKTLKKEKDIDLEIESIRESFGRADGYAESLDAFYSRMKVRAAGNKMLTFTGEDGLESCSDCQRYKNKRHRASWWISHNAVPPNRDFECKGYRCQHILMDDSGQLFTL